jgi:hypothetical protein
MDRKRNVEFESRKSLRPFRNKADEGKPQVDHEKEELAKEGLFDLCIDVWEEGINLTCIIYKTERKPKTSGKKERKAKDRCQKKERDTFLHHANNEMVDGIREEKIPNKRPQNNVEMASGAGIETRGKVPPAYFPQSGFFDGVYASPNPVPNYAILNSPILNTLRVNGQFARQQTDFMSIIQQQSQKNGIKKDPRKAPFNRASTHLVIAYHILFAKKKDATTVRLFIAKLNRHLKQINTLTTLLS